MCLQSYCPVPRRAEHSGTPCGAHHFGGLPCQQVISSGKRESSFWSSPHPAPCTLHPAAGEKKADMPMQQTVAEMGGQARAMGQRWGGSGRSSCWLIKGTRVKSGPHQAPPYAHTPTTAARRRVSSEQQEQRQHVLRACGGHCSRCSVTCFDVPLRRCPVGHASSKRRKIFGLSSTAL